MSVMHFHNLPKKASGEIKNIETVKIEYCGFFSLERKNEVKKKKDGMKLAPKKIIWIVVFKKIFVFSDLF